MQSGELSGILRYGGESIIGKNDDTVGHLDVDSRGFQDVNIF